MSTPTLPTIHNNGTSKRMLAEGYDNASTALYAFVEEWRRIEFNARDYYVQGVGAWDKALEEREAINAKIREVRDYINAHREHIYS